MRNRIPRRVTRAAVVLVVAAGLVVVGRLTADSGPQRADSYRAGHSDGYDTGYAAGLHDGVVQGRLEGRASQEGNTVPAGSRQPLQAAFKDGYAAGANDAFAGYDGGWGLSEPYVVTLERATTPIVYRISSRTPVQAGINYFLCPSGQGLCQEPRAGAASSASPSAG